MPKHADGFKFDRSTGPKQALTGEVLKTFAIGRREQVAALDSKLRSYAEELRAMIPKSLKVFANESHLADVDSLMNLVATLGSEEQHTPWSTLSAKLKTPEDYGFKDKEDAYQGMLKLKRAWKGVLDVTVTNGDWYVEVSVRGLDKRE